MPPALVIFDCDGVLVDSEGLACRLWADSAREAGGGAVAPQEALALFRGHDMAYNVAQVERLTGTRLPADFPERYRARLWRLFESDLRSVAGIEAALARIDVPVCVASSGPREKIELSLTLTGLMTRFRGRIVSAHEIGRFKPDPGLFLAAAERFGAVPASCVVVEDSSPGVLAARAAGMEILGYAAAGNAAELAASGAVVFCDMQELPRLLGLE